jgi:pimeloyl-ACP methyl ester carboxylesterase
MSADFVRTNGVLAGTYDIPDLVVYNEAFGEIKDAPPQLRLTLKLGTFPMTVHSNVFEMTGINTNWNPPVSLHLKRIVKISPPDFSREALFVTNGSLVLAGELVKPAQPPPWPAILIVHGSGPQSRRDAFYSFWGRFFADKGIAVFLYDKRGVGASSGDFKKATFDELASDVIAAAGLLEKRTDLRKNAIGAMGISQGGWIAPLAASKDSRIRFLILDVGPAVSVDHQELDRVAYTMRGNSDFTEQDIVEAVAYTRRVLDAAYGAGDTASLLQEAGDVRHKKWAEVVQIAESKEDLEGWRLSRYDPAPVLRRTKIPTLALFGEKDPYVPPKENVDRFRQFLHEAGNRDVSVLVIPGVKHDMESYGTLLGRKWQWPDNYWVWPRKSPLFYEGIIDWLEKQHLIQRS